MELEMMNATKVGNRSIRPVFFALSIYALLAVCFPLSGGTPPVARHGARHQNASRSRYGIPTFADSTEGDVAAFDDPVVRQAAIRGLGRYNGSVVAIDPNSGRILSIVNQRLAFSDGFIPCSTIKPVVAVAALQEGFVTRETKIKVARRKYLNLTEALAHSNNAYFEELGRRMGFDTVSNYARSLGLGELAGYDITQEQPGTVPNAPPARGGVARMSSFCEGIRMTPLQLGALVSTVANGGTLYYLQYPQTEEEMENFEPRIKRTLDIRSLLPDLRDGMHAAVIRGTAVRSNLPDDEEVSGKTGSCSDSNSRIGWFVSYMDQPNLKIVLVILMRGDTYAVRGPMAAGIAGRIYRRLQENGFTTKNGAQADSSILAAKSAE
jgi:cell division protein FtsI/penicillin-binding protein 2